MWWLDQHILDVTVRLEQLKQDGKVSLMKKELMRVSTVVDSQSGIKGTVCKISISPMVFNNLVRIAVPYQDKGKQKPQTI